MADIFWKFKVNRAAKTAQKSFPNLPSDIDDNVFLALSSQAAQADKDSGAYDEFHFSEDGFEKMPYEDSTDELLDHQIERTAVRADRASLVHELTIQHLEKRVEGFENKSEDIRSQIAAVEAQLEVEREILSGERRGEDGGTWIGVPPDVTSQGRHAFKQFLNWVTFIAVAAVDGFVIFLSLRLITPTESEAFQLTFPTVAVQVLFPHLVGHAWAKFRSGSKKRIQFMVEALLVFCAWSFFVFAMTQIRFNLIKDSYFRAKSEPLENNQLLSLSILIFSALILIGLGAWLMIKSMHTNPHETKYSRLMFVYFGRVKQLRRAEKRTLNARASLESEATKLGSVRSQWSARSKDYRTLGKAAKSAYRRALVNSFGEVEYTNAYLPEDRFKRKVNDVSVPDEFQYAPSTDDDLEKEQVDETAK